MAGAIDAYEIRRNFAKATINWGFSTQDTRSKLHRLYCYNFWIDPVLVSCIRSSPGYFEAFRADWKRVFYSILSPNPPKG